MAKKINIKEQHSKEQVVAEIKRSASDCRYRLRLQAILLVLEHRASKPVIEQLLIVPNTLFRWVKWYNESGFEGLKNVSLGGREEGNPIWDDKIFEALYKQLDSMDEYWSVPKMREWIKEHFDEWIPINTIRDRLKVNKYSYKSNRPNPYKGDKTKQEEFKKKWDS